MPSPMQIRFHPETRTLVITSPTKGVSRTIYLNRDETAAIAEAGNPFVIPRITTLIEQLRKISGAVLSKHMTAKVQKAAYAAVTRQRDRTQRQWTEIVDTPDGPVKIHTQASTSPSGSRTLIHRCDPRTNMITRTVIHHRPPAAPVTTTETFRALHPIKLTTSNNTVDERMTTYHHTPPPNTYQK